MPASYIEPYSAACIQNRPRIMHKGGGNDAVIEQNLTRMLDLIDYATEWGSNNVRLVVCPEYAINGPPRPVPTAAQDLIDIAVEIPGKWTDLLAKKAAEHRIYICANMLEKDRDWPGRVFNTSFIISPDGEVILKHWKHNHNASHTCYTTPSDVYDAFVARYGIEKLFPVAQTAIGNLGAITCCECYFAELTRCTVLNGAEVICGPTASNLYASDKHKIGMIQGHCISCRCYWVRANIGGFADSCVPTENYVGDSVIINHEGDRLCQVNGNGEAVVRAAIDINALRRMREHALTFGTFRGEMIAREYLRHTSWPNNGFLERPIEGLSDTKGLRREVVQRMYGQGELQRPFRP